MSTKVKGDKIKEGSIPLSALSSDMNIPSYVNFVKKLSNDDNNTTLRIEYAQKVVLVSNTDTRILNIGESTIYSNYGMVFTFTTSGSSYIDIHIEGNGSLDAFGIKVYKEINKIKKEFLPDDIGGADWNAQEGEAGYIENRTHFIEWYNKPEDENFNDLLLGLKDKTPISVTENGHIKTVKYLANECYPMWESNFEYFCKFWEVNYYDIFRAFITVPDIFGGNAYPEISLSDDDDLYVTIQWNTEDTTDNVNEVIDQICGDYYIVPYHNYSVYPLNENYLPNTLLKTTPQTLSNTAKNQALANLGIDPVVWKYICDPFVIKYYSETGEIGSTPIPIELYNIIWDKDNECLRNIVCKVLIVKITTANDISINSVNGIIDKTIINCVNNTQLEFIPYDRSFIER